MTSTPLSEPVFRFLVVLAICSAGWLAYWNATSNEFVWDDVSSVLLHRHVQDPSKFSQLFREDQHAFGRGQGSFYRPLISASFMLDFLLSRSELYTPGKIPDLNPFLFHMTNLFWHIVAGVFLFLLMTRFGAPRFVRAVVPVLFVLHPLQTEAVTYISGRADPMAAAFLFAGLWCAFAGKSVRARIAASVASVVCFSLALLSKESAAIFPFLLLLLVLVRGKTDGDDGPTAMRYLRFLPLALSFLMLGAYAYARSRFLSFGSDSGPLTTSFGGQLFGALQALAIYVRLLLLPTGLHMERTLTDATAWTALAGAVCLALLLGLVVYGLDASRRRMALASGWFLITWLPISGLFALNAPMAEHWMYVPLAGFFWALAELVFPLLAKPLARRAVLLATFAVGLAFVAITVDRNRDWRDNETLYRSTLAQNPESSRVHFNLAVTYEDIMDNMPGARRHYEEVLALYKIQKSASASDDPEKFWDEELESHLSLGEIYFGQQRYDVAAQHFGIVLNVKPDSNNKDLIASAALGMGNCYLAVGEVERAASMFQRATTLVPELKERIGFPANTAG